MNTDHEETLDRGEPLGATIDPSRLEAAHAHALEEFHIGARDSRAAVLDAGKSREEEEAEKKKQKDKKDKSK